MSIRLTFFFAAFVLLAAVHITALELYLYWKFLWLDVPMHFLGGVCIALGYSLVPLLGIRLPPALTHIFGYLAVVFCISIVWEFFEYAAGISLVENNFIFDTMLDLVMGLSGGLLGYGLIRKTVSLDQ